MSHWWTPPILETERLVLRAVTEADADAVFAACSNPNVTRFVLFDTHTTLDDSLAFVRDFASANYDEMIPDPFAITLRHDADPRLLGALGCHWVSQPHHTMELGYWLAEHLWGRGLATEAARAVLGFVFRNYPVERIQARVIAGNPASGRVLQKVGFSLEGRHRSVFFRHGQFVDAEMYSILRGEWCE